LEGTRGSNFDHFLDSQEGLRGRDRGKRNIVGQLLTSIMEIWVRRQPPGELLLQRAKTNPQGEKGGNMVRILGNQVRKTPHNIHSRFKIKK